MALCSLVASGGLRARLGVLRVVAVLLVVACAGGGSVSLPGPTAVPDIRSYPPLPNDAAPGASASALATATAIGRGVNFGNMLEAPTEGAWGLTVTDDFIDKAAAAGFTSVRVPVRWSNHASIDAPFTIDATFMGRVEAV
ncbi:MAG: cellulase family glycosylhydrolase, partial [bacterium]